METQDIKEFAKIVDGPASFLGYGLKRWTLINRETARRSEAVDAEYALTLMKKFRANQRVIQNPCQRCGGEGRILTYTNFADGVCFRCNGTGRERASA